MLLRRSVYLILEGRSEYIYSLLNHVCMSVCVRACVCVSMCVHASIYVHEHVCVHLPQPACGGQRTTSAVHLHGLFCLRWTFLFAAR